MNPATREFLKTWAILGAGFWIILLLFSLALCGCGATRVNPVNPFHAIRPNPCVPTQGEKPLRFCPPSAGAVSPCPQPPAQLSPPAQDRQAPASLPEGPCDVPPECEEECPGGMCHLPPVAAVPTSTARVVRAGFPEWCSWWLAGSIFGVFVAGALGYCLGLYQGRPRA